MIPFSYKKLRRPDQNKSQAPKGFTLVELLVAVAILAVLTSLLQPALVKVLKSANVIVCATQQKEMGGILYFHTEDNDGLYPSTMLPSVSDSYWAYPNGDPHG